MKEHPHLHCIMPAGGLSFDKNHWIHTDKKNDFFIHYKIISRKFRGKFLDLLQQAFDKKQLFFKGDTSPLTARKNFAFFKDALYKKEWVVNIQAPLGKPEKILEYLSRYVFRIAITNRRILEVKNGKVLFCWKDYKTNRFRKMKLEIDEFIRRFLLHILPKGFFKVRYYGIFSSRYRQENLKTSIFLLKTEQKNLQNEALEDGRQIWKKQDTIWEEISELIAQIKLPNCPKCNKGRMKFAGSVRIMPDLPG